jgi:hypothetical protein
MTERTGPRCPYTLDVDYRPVLAAVATARAAGRPTPPTDWRCVREPHRTTGGEQHLAMPLGVTGRSVRFSDTSAEPLAPIDLLMPTADMTDPANAITAAGGWCAPASYFLDAEYQPVDVPPSMSVPIDPEVRVPVVHAHYNPAGGTCIRTLLNGHTCGGTPDDHRVYAAPPRRHADPADVRALIELIDRPGTSCLHIADGDELLLLMPEGDDATVEQATRALSDLFPTVTFLVLQGITGAVAITRAGPSDFTLAPSDTAAYEQLAAGHADLAAQRQHLVDQGIPPADLIHPRRPIPPLGYQPPPRQA